MGRFQLEVKSENKEIFLVGVNGNNVTSTGVFDNLPLYEGHAFYESDDRILIDSVSINGKSVNITQIKECSLSNCRSLREIYLSKHIIFINWNMFGCDNLLNIFVDKNNPFYIDKEGVLYKQEYGTIKSLVGFPAGRTGSYTILDGIKEICNCAFKSSQLSQIIIPDSVEIIGSNVFYLCKNLKEVVLPKNLKVFHLNCNPKHDCKLVQVPQKFYLADDTKKLHPYSSFEISEMFHV